MKKGDKAMVVNLRRLTELHDQVMLGDIVTIDERIDPNTACRSHWLKPGEVEYRVTRVMPNGRIIDWWLPGTCLQLIEHQREQDNEMKKGDRVLLINPDELKKEEVDHLYMKEGFITGFSDDGFTVTVDVPREGKHWYVPRACIQVLSKSGSAELKAGDAAVIHAEDKQLGAIGLKTGWRGCRVTLNEKLLPSDLMGIQKVYGQIWRVFIHHPTADSGKRYWIPVAWLRPLTTQPETKTENGKENTMNPVTITITKVPSEIAQQAGAKEEVVATGTEIASTNIGAAVIVAAKNSPDILEAFKDANIKVYCASAGQQC